MIRILTWMMLVVMALIVVTLIGLADVGRGRHFFLWVGQVPAGDKVGHLIIFGLMALLANLALNGARLRFGSWTVLKGSLFVLVPTVLEEFSQIFFRSRTFDLRDLAADFLGIFLGGLLAVLLLRSLNLWTSRGAAVQTGNGSVVAPSLRGE
jgi:hypothetical protein